MKRKDSHLDRQLDNMKISSAIQRKKIGPIPAPKVFKDRKRDQAKYRCRGKWDL